jgi:hypothetical protein
MRNLEFRIKNEKLKAVGYGTQFSILHSQFVICCLGFALMTFTAEVGQAEESLRPLRGLRFRFQQGDKYFLLFNTTQKVEQDVNNQPQITEQTIRLGCDFEITEVEEGGDAWAKYTYRQVAMKSAGSGGDNEFDSEADVNRPKIPLQVLPWYVALGEDIYIKITPHGSITRINGLQAIITSAQSKVLVSAARNRMAAAFDAIDALFTEAEVKTILEDQLAVFPDPCVRPAATDIAVCEPNHWNRIKRIEESDMVIESTFRLAEGPASSKRVEAGGPDGNAIIDVNLVIKTADDSKEMVSSGIKTRREVRGQGRGQIEIDESTGQIINKRLAYDWVDEIKAVSEGQVRRIPPVPKPVRTHVETTFQMIKRDLDPSRPTRGRVEAGKPSAEGETSPTGGSALPEPNKS